MDTAIKHPVHDCVKPFICDFWHTGTLTLRAVKNYNWRLNPVWHRMLYSCIHMTTMGVKRLMNFIRMTWKLYRCNRIVSYSVFSRVVHTYIAIYCYIALLSCTIVFNGTLSVTVPIVLLLYQTNLLPTIAVINVCNVYKINLTNAFVNLSTKKKKKTVRFQFF